MINSTEKGHVLLYTNAGSAIKSGDVVVIGELVGIAVVDIANGATGSVDVSGQVFELTKNAPLAIAQGDALYWNTTSKYITKTVTDVPIGTAFEAALSADVTVQVKMYPNGNTVSQAAYVAPLTDSTGGTPGATLAAITAGASYAQADLVAVKNAIASLNTKLTAVEAALEAAGLMASS